MKRFFRYFFAIVLGGIVSAIFITLIFVLIMAGLSAKQKKPYEVKTASVYNLKLDKPIVERSPENLFSSLNIFPESSNETIGLNDILKNIKKAEEQENIKGIFLELSFLQAGIATADEIRLALEKFKKSGKFIIAYGNMMDKKSYYIASVADKVYLNPLGVIELTGLKAETHFFKGAFEKLGIEPKVFRVGKYKSYGERFDSKKLSPENREQLNSYISDVWMRMLNNISLNRNIDVTRLNEIASNLEIFDPHSYITNNLIDSLIYNDELFGILKKNSGVENDKKLNLVSHTKMNKVEQKRDYKGFAKEKIAIIYAYGGVIMGNQGEGSIGSERISKAIEQAREDSLTKAIVLRVNSGGGSALASEIIWRELKLATKIKPVVVTMGDMAASGGYYISVPADTIIANPFTLTGSIGVIGVTFNAKEFFNEKLGITNDVVKTNPYADFGNVFREMSPVEEVSINKMIEIVYNSFVSHVAENRKMTFNEVHEIAQGHIWGGEQARHIGLVDDFGSIDKAIEIAARMAKTEKYRIVELPKLEDPLEKLFNDASDDAGTRLLHKELGDLYKYYTELKELFQGGMYQSRLPFNIDIN